MWGKALEAERVNTALMSSVAKDQRHEAAAGGQSGVKRRASEIFNNNNNINMVLIKHLLEAKYCS